MKSYQIWLFLGLTLIFQNCTKNNECTPDTEQFIFQENKEIGITVLYEDLSIVYRYDIEEGENLVMEYIFDQEQCDPVQDDEYGYRLAFEVDDGLESFSFENEALYEIKAHFQEFGAWVNHRQRPVRKGKISGQKRNNNRWAIQIDVTTDSLTFDGPKHLVIDEIFRN